MAAKRETVRLTAERVRELFNYVPETGELSAKVADRNRPVGLVYDAESKLSVDGESFKVAQICFVAAHGYWPMGLVDHKNRNKRDNSKANLRDVSHTQNQQNKVSPNPHGYKGVTWRDRKSNPWLAKIRANGVRINLGSFPTREEAAWAYEEACLKYHGDFAQLGVK